MRSAPGRPGRGRRRSPAAKALEHRLNSTCLDSRLVADLRVAQPSQLAPDGLGGFVPHSGLPAGLLGPEVEVLDPPDRHALQMALRPPHPDPPNPDAAPLDSHLPPP